jgi:hypothetical protein
MAAGYQIATTANKRTTWRQIMKDTRYSANVPLDPVGLYAFNTGAQTVAITNTETIADALFTFQFPNNCYLYDLQVTFSALDAGSTLVVDVITSTTGASGGTEVVLINDSTAGQAGGSDELDRNTGHMLRDVSGLYLGFKVGAAATTVAAGTVTFKGIIHIGSPVTGF